MKTIASIMLERPLILDGGMGSQIFAYEPTVDDYGGVNYEGCVELLNERKPQWIQKIHENYFNAGSDAVETNTFGCNDVVLSEFGLEHRTVELNIQAAKLALEVANSFNTPKFVVGSVGPGTKLLTLNHVTYQILFDSYLSQMRGLIMGGVHSILIETCQDLGQIKLAVRAARKAMLDLNKKLPIWVQVTIETTGSTLVGTDIQAVLAALEMLNIDVIGMNCATGPDEMRPHIAYLSQAAPMAVSCLPNAGLPSNEGGKTVYKLGPADFASKMLNMMRDFNLNIVGGCCGTTPEHIQALSAVVGSVNLKQRQAKYERSVTSLYQSVSLNLEPRPLFVGERTNANGSKKFRDLLAAEDFDGLVSIAKGQLKEGAHILDVCVAYVSRNETRDMEEFIKRLVTQVNIPIMIDSTEFIVMEKALQCSPGKNIINSINFEDGDEKPRKVLGLCKEYGAAIVALTIDEQGMAKTVEQKLAIAKRLYDMAVGEFQLSPEDLIIDPLTFTLGSGDEEFRKSAIETLKAIEEIKKQLPGVKTILGLSNVSFGLHPYPRQILNSMMLFHAVKYGLDMAILNASKIVPLSKIDDNDRQIFADLIFDRRTVNSDPLKLILAKHTDSKFRSSNVSLARDTLSIEEKLKQDIIDGEKQLIVLDVHEALHKYPPLDIINNILLAGMKIVGERFGSGEMQLPFVLESAEAMKAAVKVIEPLLEKKQGYSKGKMILATVKGDVHDIGKNLVEIILSNNGFEVVNLGIKQPIETILEKYREQGADAIGLSGLLVKSTVIMKENLEYMASQGFKLPVILGGAALTRKFVEEECQEIYPGPVFYAGDAFEGLALMDKISALKPEIVELSPGEIKNKMGLSSVSITKDQQKIIQVVRKGESKVLLDSQGQSTWVRRNEAIPRVPFFGTKLLEENFETIFKYLDEFALIRSRWGFNQGQMSELEFERVINNKAEPLLKEMSAKFRTEKLIHPKAIYGYYPACSDGNEILVYAPETNIKSNPEERKILQRFSFPRQTSGRKLCISDYLKHKNTGELDVVGVQIVTMGIEASTYAAQLYEQEKFSEYFYVHGLATELTEAYAEVVHKRMRDEWAISHKDAPTMRQLFSQGYQGSRYSFGYPACPDMEGNAPLLQLLGAERIGIELSESFQMVPELTTAALVIWHPQARYFST